MPKRFRQKRSFCACFLIHPLQELKLLHTESYESKTSEGNILKHFYHTFSEIKDEVFDAMIITGHRVELLEFGRGGIIGKNQRRLWTLR